LNLWTLCPMASTLTITPTRWHGKHVRWSSLIVFNQFNLLF
jgi:hypothetical protein